MARPQEGDQSTQNFAHGQIKLLISTSQAAESNAIFIILTHFCSHLHTVL